MPELIEIGYIANSHGVKGHVKVSPNTDFPERFKRMKSAVIEKYNGAFVEFTINEVFLHKNLVIIKFNEINDMDAAKGLKGSKIVVERSDLMELPEDSYYIFDLLGCKVYEREELLGTVKDIIETGSNDVYVVECDEVLENEKDKTTRKGKKELLIPALAWVVLNVDTDNKRIDVSLPEGLREL